MTYVLYRSILLSALMLGCCLIGLAQTAEVTGIVKDASQAVVANVRQKNHKHYGSPEATAAAVKKRDEYCEIIGDRIVREVILK